MLVNGYELIYKINLKPGPFKTHRDISQIKETFKIGESDNQIYAAMTVYKDGVVLFIDFIHQIAYTNNESFKYDLESQN